MNWFYKIAQQYPGGDYQGQGYGGKPYYGFRGDEKFKYWGYEPSERVDTHDFKQQLARSPFLTRLPPKDIEFIVTHLAEKFAPETEQHVISYTKDWCDMDTHRWAWNACRCAQGLNQWHKEPEAYSEDPDNCYQGGERCGSISLGKSLKHLYSECEQIAKNLAQKHEITDKEFIQNFIHLLNEEVINKIGNLIKNQLKDQPFFVRVYGSNEAFGGPEEGGWWYTDKQLVDEQKASNLQSACQLKSQLENQYQNKGRDSFHEDMANMHGNLRDVYDEDTSGDLGLGDVPSSSLSETEGMEIPRGWTPSEFKNFFVTVELADNPIQQTQGVPRYSNSLSRWLKK